MAEPTKTFTFDEAKVTEKLAALEKAVQEVAGKPNYNPYKWFESEVRPLVNRFKGNPDKAPERTEALQVAILAIPSTIPVLDKNYQPEAKEAPRTPPPKVL